MDTHRKRVQPPPVPTLEEDDEDDALAPGNA
jgi:hypothetical protein